MRKYFCNFYKLFSHRVFLLHIPAKKLAIDSYILQYCIFVSHKPYMLRPVDLCLRGHSLLKRLPVRHQLVTTMLRVFFSMFVVFVIYRKNFHWWQTIYFKQKSKLGWNFWQHRMPHIYTINAKLFIVDAVLPMNNWTRTTNESFFFKICFPLAFF